MLKFVANKSNQGLRLDVYITQQINGLSRSSIQKLCQQGKILVNSTHENQNYKLRPKDTIEVAVNLNDLHAYPSIELPIIYEDEDCLVINKPVGILTHSKGAFNPEATVASFIHSKLHDLEGERAGIVHRLDRATSGVIICAKTPSALVWLQKQFSNRKVKKVYYAIISGHLNPEQAIIDMPIERHPRTPKLFRASSAGKPAITDYKVVARNNRYDLLELLPQTGRTHQLRVHLKQLGHPIVGDTLYKGEPADRLYLHAEKLELTLPNHERKVFTVPIPSSFRSKMKSND